MLNGDSDPKIEKSVSMTAISMPQINSLASERKKRHDRSSYFHIIVDTGCSTTSTGYQEDFVPNTLKPLRSVISGISGNMKISHEGIARYEVLDDNNNIQVLQLHAFLVPNMRTRLLSPQAFFQELRRNRKDLYGKLKLEMDADALRIIWPDDNISTIRYDCCTRMPKLLACHDATKLRFNPVSNECVTTETNTNLTTGQKELLKWHYKLGHLDFKWVQWLNANMMLGPTCIPSSKIPAIKCEACQLGKQHKRPTGHTHITHKTSGKLKKAITEPGERIFMDSYVSRLPGRAFAGRGASSGCQYHGGSIFADAATGYVFVSHQVGQTAAEALESKMRFEREAATCGVTVKMYHTDNGVFTSKEFMAELIEKGQGVRFCGVSAHFQNGAAENAIKNVTNRARTIMFHAFLHWPENADRNLWPMAMSHAAYLHNVTPSQTTGLSPFSLFTRTEQKPQALIDEHVWGCPAYVLAPKLKDGQKIPKWEPRSRRGQYMGRSPLHASTVGLVRNLQTGTITPQYHMVYDDFFETIHHNGNEKPKVWKDLFVTSRFKSSIDEDDMPTLDDEWLTSEESLQRTVESLSSSNDTLRQQELDNKRARYSQERQTMHDL
jgi:hypothetical protein